MKIHRIEHIEIHQLTIIRDALLAADLLILRAEADITREQMAQMLFGIRHGRPVFVLDLSSGCDSVSSLAKFSGTHYVRSCHSWDIDERMATKCAEHACGERLSLAFNTDLVTCLQCAESPIEERMAVHLCMAMDLEGEVIPQAEMSIDGRKYRADFMLSEPEHGVRLVIEVDGHDFHERTKEQAKRDRSRDRGMLAAGYPVMRFTGSEVWNAPAKCAREAVAYFSSLVSARNQKIGELDADMAEPE